MRKIKNLFVEYKHWFLVFAVFALELFLRFYQIEERNPFGWDQVDNAWAAKDLIINHHWPLVGMVAKGNSGFYIGPFYYYLIALVYWFTHLDPIASGIFAGLTSIFSFWVLFFVTKKIFSFRVALVAVFMQTVASSAIIFDRVQWPVNFIPAISLLVFYFLYKVITGNPRYLVWLAITMGLAFHVHFTAIFFPLIVFLSLPFFPRNRKTVTYFLISLPLLLIWFVPTIIYELQHRSSQAAHLGSYAGSYYHGFHIRRVFQIIGDGFIQFEPFLFPAIKFLKFILLPLFIIVYVWNELFEARKRRGLSRQLLTSFVRDHKVKLSYLMILYFIVPWFVFSTYAGEISDYYFSINRFIVVIIIAYLLMKVFEMKYVFAKIFIILFLLFYGYTNITQYLDSHDAGLKIKRQTVLDAISHGQRIEYTEGVPESYLYYYYMGKKGKNVY